MHLAAGVEKRMNSNVLFKSMAQVGHNVHEVLRNGNFGFILCEKIMLLCHMWLDGFHVEK